MEDSSCLDDRIDTSLASQASLGESSTSLQIPTPQQIARVNFDSYTCKLGWSSHGDMCAVSTETRVHVYSYQETEMRHRGSLKHAECLYDWQWCGDSDLIVTTGRYQPVHLNKVEDEQIHIAGTYKCINHLDERQTWYSIVPSSIDVDMKALPSRHSNVLPTCFQLSLCDVESVYNL